MFGFPTFHLQLYLYRKTFSNLILKGGIKRDGVQLKKGFVRRPKMQFLLLFIDIS